MLWLWLLQLFVDINCAYFGGSPDGEATKRGIIYKKILTYVRRFTDEWLLGSSMNIRSMWP
jgi:hypothetical protein